MPHFGYSFQGYNPLIHARASAREIAVSPKAAREVCREIKNLSIPKAKTLLGEVISQRSAIPFRRHQHKVGHRSEIFKFHAGRYPKKAAIDILTLIGNLEANAEFKGLDIEKLFILHAAVSRGRVIKGYTPRAFGRTSPSFNTLIHIELVGKEI